MNKTCFTWKDGYNCFGELQRRVKNKIREIQALSDPAVFRFMAPKIDIL